MGHPVEYNGAGKPDNRKKILFIAAAFLLVIALLFGLFSYAKFRKKFHGNVIMPEAKLLQAQLTLDMNLEKIASGQLETYLAQLQPGDDVKQFTEEDEADHRMVVTILNHAVVSENPAKQAGEDTYSAIPMKYRIRIGSAGHLPLEFILIDTQDSKQYISRREENEYRFYEIVTEADPEEGENPEVTVSETEAEFLMEYSTSELKNIYRIYVGWDNDADEAMDLTAAKYRKEVELLKVAVTVDSDDPGVGYTYSKEELQGLIPVPADPAPEEDQGT